MKKKILFYSKMIKYLKISTKSLIYDENNAILRKIVKIKFKTLRKKYSSLNYKIKLKKE